MSGNRWKGKGYNEQHIDALSHALNGDPKQIVLHEVKLGLENRDLPEFFQLLIKLLILRDQWQYLPLNSLSH